jgi:transposase
MPIRRGAIQGAVDRVSSPIPPYDEALAAQARQAPVNSTNETAWYRHGGLAWLWGMVNPTVAFFKVQASRGQTAFEAVVQHGPGILIGDGDGVSCQGGHTRQTGLAHLLRRARELAERQDPELARCGRRMLDQHRERQDATGTYARTWECEPDTLWTFMVEKDVNPTNTRPERALQFAGLWRKLKQGTSNEKGDRWVERTLSLRDTCRLQSLPTCPLLVEAITCYFNGLRPDVSWI